MNTENSTENSADMLSMSDDEIMNMVSPPVQEAIVEADPSGSEGGEAEGQGQEENKVDETPGDGEGSPSGSEASNKGAENQKENSQQKNDEKVKEEDDVNPLSKSDEDLKDKPEPKKKESKKEEKPEDKAADSKDEKKEEGDGKVKAEEETPAVTTPNYEEAYKKIMGPIKASGRTIQLQTPEEAITLIQMGADYTRRMQQLRPNLKMMKMLEKNGLLSEEKISFFIDLDKKDPAALTKFLKDKEIDPLDLDMSSDHEYKPGNHTISDTEMRFNTTLEEVGSTQSGREIIEIIDKEWDRVSQGRVYKEPEILKLMEVHRSTGIYEQITGEMERLKLLKVIPEDTPFLDAYKSVGDNLHQTGKLLVEGKPTNSVVPSPQQFQPKSEGKPEAKPENRVERQVVDKKTAAPKPAASNGDAAKAAMTTRTSPSKTIQDFNPLAMSDEEFEKQSGGSFRI